MNVGSSPTLGRLTACAMLLAFAGGCTGNGGDPTSSPLTLTVTAPDCSGGQILKPTTYELVATVDGDAVSARFEVSGTSGTFEVAAELVDGVARGTHTFTALGTYNITVLADTGLQVEASDPPMVCAVANGAPSITSLTPQSNAEYTEEDTITFSARVSDSDDDPGDLTVVWTSATDNELATAIAGADGVATAEVTGLSAVNHFITARVTDPWGGADETTLSVRIDECDDSDGDGFSECNDCDDKDDQVYPGAVEVCDGKDNDCNDEVDELGDADGDTYAQCVSGCEEGGDCVLDCDDTNASINPGAAETCDTIDNNCNGSIDEGYDLDQDGFSACTAEIDCDDNEPNAYPGNVETCDTLDNDCDNLTDEGLAQIYYRDADNDTYGDPENSISLCVGGLPGGFVTNSDDCDDTRATVYLGAEEACDGFDNDCDLTVDEGQPQTTFYIDADSDGYGDPLNTVDACVLPAGAQENSDDCNDADVAINPQAVEVCDTVDQDCDSSVDEGTTTAFYPDTDSDGYGEEVDVVQACEAPNGYVSIAGDCDPDNPDTYPQASERCDSADNDCDTTVDEGAAETFYYDGDGDGYGTDSNTQITCEPDDGYVAIGGDCKDGQPAVNPGADETCDGRDEDCDDLTDEGVKNTYYEDADGDGFGTADTTAQACSVPDGFSVASGDCDDTTPDSYPNAAELCDGLDNDCNGEIDNGLTLLNFYTDADGDGFGDDTSVVQACAAPPGTSAVGGDCRDGNAAINPDADEVCNAKDDDCDDGVDEGVKITYYKDVDRDGYGTTEERLACSQCDGCALTDDDCDDTDPETYPGAPEKFDGQDNDCDEEIEREVPLGSAHASFGGVNGGSYAGATVARIGDIDGDLINDVAFAAPRAANRSGRVYVVYGKTSGWGHEAVSAADVTLSISVSDVEAGRSISGGDLDNDGVNDLFVGIPSYDGIGGTAAQGGHVSIIYGGGRVASGDLIDLESAYVAGYFPSVYMGSALSSGDVTCDGIDDLIIAGPWTWTAQYPNPGGGAVFIVPGLNSPYSGPGGIGGSDLIQIYGNNNDLLGQDVAYVGNVGGSSCGDFAISANGVSGMGPNKIEDMGRTYLIAGGDSAVLQLGQPLEAPDLDLATWDGTDDNDRTGASVAGVGDVDGDTVPDFVIGKGQTTAGEPLGLLFLGGDLPSGGNADSLANVAVISNQGLRCPCEVAGLGDVNSDGLDDFAVAVPGADSGGTIFVFFGREGGWPSTVTAEVYADVIIEAESAGDDAGISIAGLGDVNGDSYDDFIIGARTADGEVADSGKVYVFFGYGM